MKRISVLFLLSGILVATGLFGQNELAELAGKWLRDDIVVAKKKHLPRVTWSITLDDKTLTLAELSEQGETLRKRTYNLDGTETQSVGRSPNSLSAQKFKWNKSKRTVEIREVMIVSGIPNIPPEIFEIKETWQLGKAGNTLKVVQKVESRNPQLREFGGLELLHSKETFQRVQ